MGANLRWLVRRTSGSHTHADRAWIAAIRLLGEELVVVTQDVLTATSLEKIGQATRSSLKNSVAVECQHRSQRFSEISTPVLTRVGSASIHRNGVRSTYSSPHRRAARQARTNAAMKHVGSSFHVTCFRLSFLLPRHRRRPSRRQEVTVAYAAWLPQADPTGTYPKRYDGNKVAGSCRGTAESLSGTH